MTVWVRCCPGSSRVASGKYVFLLLASLRIGGSLSFQRISVDIEPAYQMNSFELCSTKTHHEQITLRPEGMKSLHMTWDDATTDGGATGFTVCWLLERAHNRNSKGGSKWGSYSYVPQSHFVNLQHAVQYQLVHYCACVSYFPDLSRTSTRWAMPREFGLKVIYICNMYMWFDSLRVRPKLLLWSKLQSAGQTRIYNMWSGPNRKPAHVRIRHHCRTGPLETAIYRRNIRFGTVLCRVGQQRRSQILCKPLYSYIHWIGRQIGHAADRVYKAPLYTGVTIRVCNVYSLLAGVSNIRFSCECCRIWCSCSECQRWRIWV